MISVSEAVVRILEQTPARVVRHVPLSLALGCVLAEPVFSPIDSPPYDKSLMDGYALRMADLQAGHVELEVLEQVVAGSLPTRPVLPGTATNIMTGAPLPEGADTVVMVERTERCAAADGRARVRISDPRLSLGQNILRRGASMRCGEQVLDAGTRLRPSEIGLLAEIGVTDPLVHPRPRVAILSTGNELVPANQTLGPGQIRNSNGPMLAAFVQQRGGLPIELGIARDETADLTRLMQQGLKADILVLSGGVSAGVLDLVPRVLGQLGVQQVFHQVHLKPGKPVWFGVLPGEPQTKLVFALPGNPVSSLVCFELFVAPALARLAGRPRGELTRCLRPLAAAHRQPLGRPTYHPARLRTTATGEQVEVLAWQGSADLRCLAEANCLAFFPAEQSDFAAGEVVEVYLLDMGL